MRVFALVVVKNEGDIISDTISAASTWADKVFVMDNMSTDTTWEKLVKLESENEKVVLWGRYGGKFNDGLRQVIYREYSSLANENDWWCRLDGDEFYIDDPREFLKGVPEKIDHIYNASFQYYFTQVDYQEEILLKKSKTYKELEWYKCNHSEIRFVKNKKDVCWPQGEGWPCNLRFPHMQRIRLKHFQYRSISQIEERLSIRSLSSLGDAFKHEVVSEDMWYKRRGFSVPTDVELHKFRIVDEKDLENSKNYIYSDDSLPIIIKPSLVKKIKCIIVSFYMKFLNNHLFKI